MMVCEHFSQRSIADITFNWSRLTLPALAERHAAPWSRKTSATSSFGRGTVARAYGGGCSVLGVSLVWWAFGWFFLGFPRRCRSISSGLSMLAIMPVATRV